MTCGKGKIHTGLQGTHKKREKYYSIIIHKNLKCRRIYVPFSVICRYVLIKKYMYINMHVRIEKEKEN
jgi:hypothetical protein